MDILIEPKACDITQVQMDMFGLSNIEHYKFFAQLGIGFEQQFYHDLYDTAFFDVFGLDDPDRESCGSLVTELYSPYSFFFDFPIQKALTLQPLWEDQEGIFLEAYQKFTINGISTTIPITATVWNCDLISVGFAKTQISIEYEIGTGTTEKQIPAVEQKPECNLVFSEFIASVSASSNEAATAAVKFENGAFSINSFDYSLDSHTILYNVYIDTPIIATDPLLFDITFTKPAPQFNRAGLTVTPITCSSEDALWSLEIPPMINPTIQVVSVQMTTASSVVTYAPGVVTIN